MPIYLKGMGGCIAGERVVLFGSKLNSSFLGIVASTMYYIGPAGLSICFWKDMGPTSWEGCRGTWRWKFVSCTKALVRGNASVMLATGPHTKRRQGMSSSCYGQICMLIGCADTTLLAAFEEQWLN